MPPLFDIPVLHAKAEAGDVAAQAQLGTAYFDGLGVKQNYAEAYFWFTLAGSSEATKAASKLSAAERAYAEKLAARWKTPAPAVQETTKAPVKTPKTRKEKIVVAIGVSFLLILNAYLLSTGHGFSVLAFFLGYLLG